MEIDEGRCHFHRLPAAEVKQRQEAYDQKLRASEIKAKKQRSDAGKKRGKKGPKASSAATVVGKDKDDKDEESDSSTADQPQAKRARWDTRA